MTMKIQEVEAVLEKQELDFFIKGNLSLEKSTRRKAFEWFPEQGWEDLIKLQEVCPAEFGSLADDVERNEKMWKAVRFPWVVLKRQLSVHMYLLSSSACFKTPSLNLIIRAAVLPRLVQWWWVTLSLQAIVCHLCPLHCTADNWLYLVIESYHVLFTVSCPSLPACSPTILCIPTVCVLLCPSSLTHSTH